MAKHQDIQQQLFEEIAETTSKYDEKITYDAIQEMQYLDGVVSEAMRIYSVGFTMNKVCTKPFKLPPLPGQSEGFTIPKGMPIAIPVYSLHM